MEGQYDEMVYQDLNMRLLLVTLTTGSGLRTGSSQSALGLQGQQGIDGRDRRWSITMAAIG